MQFAAFRAVCQPGSHSTSSSRGNPGRKQAATPHSVDSPQWHRGERLHEARKPSHEISCQQNKAHTPGTFLSQRSPQCYKSTQRTHRGRKDIPPLPEQHRKVSFNSRFPLLLHKRHLLDAREKTASQISCPLLFLLHLPLSAQPSCSSHTILCHPPVLHSSKPWASPVTSTPNYSARNEFHQMIKTQTHSVVHRPCTVLATKSIFFFLPGSSKCYLKAMSVMCSKTKFDGCNTRTHTVPWFWG